MNKLKTLKCALAVLSVACITSCGGGSNDNPTPDKPDTPVTPDKPDTPDTPDTDTDSIASLVDSNGKLKEKTKITLWSTTGSNNLPYLQSYIEAFEAEQPNIEVESVVTGSDYTALKDLVVKGFTSNSYPDLAVCYPDHVAEYLNYDKAVELDQYISNSTVGWSEEDLADIIPDYLDEGKQYLVEGTYSVPYCVSSEQMFYNEDVLIGLDLSAIDSTINGGRPLDTNYFNHLTWDELFDKLCPAIMTYNDALSEDKKILKEDQAYHAVFGYDSDDNLFITLAKQYGYGYTSVDTKTGKASVDFNNDGMKSLMRKFNDAAKKGYIISKGSAGGTFVNSYFNVQNTLFSVGSTGGVKYQFSASNPMNVGVARIPQASDDNAYTIKQGPSLCVLDHNDKNRELASWLFYKFLSNEENSLDWALNTGYFPIRYSGLESAEFLAAADYESCEEKTQDRLMAYSKAKMNDLGTLYTSPAFKGSSDCRSQGSGIMTKALTKTSNIDELDQWFADAEAQAKLAL